MVLAGALAGAAGSAGGVTSLVTYPVMLALGLSPLVANVTQSVAFVAAGPGSVAASRPELKGQLSRLRGWAPLAFAGSLAGVVLLLALPAGAFARAVPFLLVLAAVALLSRGRVLAWRQTRRPLANRAVTPGCLLAVSVYNGYFGAGAGVMLLAVITVLVEPRLRVANALKNALLGLADLFVAVAFVIFAPVRWPVALPLALGLLVGSNVGPRMTRHVPEDVVRGLAAVAGLALAVWLWVAPG